MLSLCVPLFFFKLSDWNLANFYRDQDPAPAPGAAPSVAALKLESFEKKLSTLQLSLEVLGEWCTVLDTAGVADEVEDEEEEWGGIPMEHDEDSMGDDNDEEDVGIIRRKPEDDVDMDEGGNLEGDEVKAGEASLELGPSALTLFTELPTLLLALTERTSLSFVPSQAAVTPADTRIPTSSNAISTTPHVPQPLLGISEILTTIHVRALECLNNLYITFARSLASSSTSSSGALLESESFQADLQKSWEGCMEMVLKCLETEVTSVSVEKKKTEVAGEEVELETEERKMESVMAGVGVAWGLARIGLGEGGNLVRLLFGFRFVAWVVANVREWCFSGCWPVGYSILDQRVLTPLRHLANSFG